MQLDSDNVEKKKKTFASEGPALLSMVLPFFTGCKL